MGVIADSFVAFAQPLLDESDGSVEGMNRALSLAQFCYNLALSPEDARDEMLEDFRSALSMDDEEFETFRSVVVVPMIQRHESMFPGMHGRALFGSWEREPTPHMRAPIAESREKRTDIDRYGPCPCNSGKKYKFCCGKKPR